MFLKGKERVESQPMTAAGKRQLAGCEDEKIIK
jgi:hypothetical protein